MNSLLKILQAFAVIWFFAISVGVPMLTLLSSPADEIAGSNRGLALGISILKFVAVTGASAAVGCFILKRAGLLQKKHD